MLFLDVFVWQKKSQILQQDYYLNKTKIETTFKTINIYLK